MAEMAINIKHWKKLMFMENFLAETWGKDITEYLYVGCAGTYGTRKDVRDSEHAYEKCYWHLTQVVRVRRLKCGSVRNRFGMIIH